MKPTTKAELQGAIEHAKKIGVDAHLIVYSGAKPEGIMSRLNQQLGRISSLIEHLPEDEKNDVGGT